MLLTILSCSYLNSLWYLVLSQFVALARHFFLLILHWACGISYVESTPRSLLHAGTRSSDKFLSALFAVMAHNSVAWGQESFLSCLHADPESTHCTPIFWQSECFNRKHVCFFSCHVCGQRIWAYVQVFCSRAVICDNMLCTYAYLCIHIYMCGKANCVAFIVLCKLFLA